MICFVVVSIGRNQSKAMAGAGIRLRAESVHNSNVQFGRLSNGAQPQHQKTVQRVHSLTNTSKFKVEVNVNVQGV